MQELDIAGMGSTRVTRKGNNVVVLEKDLQTEQMVLAMGPQHPSTHGVLKLECLTDGEVVTHAEPYLGYLHRCFEKCCENVDYQAVVPYTDRLDYLAGMNSEFAYAITVEKLLDIEIPRRVEFIRVIVAELNRIASHLVAIGTYGIDLGAFTPFLFCFRDREIILSEKPLFVELFCLFCKEVIGLPILRTKGSLLPKLCRSPIKGTR
jgi:NADH-quinone oxidoreductase subunit D